MRGSMAFVELNDHFSLVDLSQLWHLRHSWHHHLRSILSPTMFCDFRIAQHTPMNGQTIQRTLQTVARVAALRRADPNVVIVDHRSLCGGTIHAPHPLGGRSVNPSTHRVGLTKLIRQSHMMPAGLDLE